MKEKQDNNKINNVMIRDTVYICYKKLCKKYKTEC